MMNGTIGRDVLGSIVAGECFASGSPETLKPAMEIEQDEPSVQVNASAAMKSTWQTDQ